jgi:hypothetical protein
VPTEAEFALLDALAERVLVADGAPTVRRSTDAIVLNHIVLNHPEAKYFNT